jgi:predicted GNAT superfamily acetyltransferase
MITVGEGRLDDVMAVLQGIPEFDNLPDAEAIMVRLKDVPHLILTASDQGKAVGFKIGYERDGHFYSWLGGVIPSCRKHGIAGLLADKQEQWAKAQGYTTIWMKTRNRFPAMLLMAIRRGFRITRIEPRDKIAEHRIVLTKSL